MGDGAKGRQDEWTGSVAVGSKFFTLTLQKPEGKQHGKIDSILLVPSSCPVVARRAESEARRAKLEARRAESDEFTIVLGRS